MSVTGHEYDPSKKPTKAEKLKASSQEGKAGQKTPAAEKEDHPTPTPEVYPQMPPLEDVTLLHQRKSLGSKPQTPQPDPNIPKRSDTIPEHFRCQNLNTFFFLNVSCQCHFKMTTF